MLLVEGNYDNCYTFMRNSTNIIDVYDTDDLIMESVYYTKFRDYVNMGLKIDNLKDHSYARLLLETNPFFIRHEDCYISWSSRKLLVCFSNGDYAEFYLKGRKLYDTFGDEIGYADYIGFLHRYKIGGDLEFRCYYNGDFMSSIRIKKYLKNDINKLKQVKKEYIFS